MENYAFLLLQKQPIQMWDWESNLWECILETFLMTALCPKVTSLLGSGTRPVAGCEHPPVLKGSTHLQPSAAPRPRSVR